MSPRNDWGFETRRAQPSDAEGIADAHSDSIRSIGARFYPPNIVEDWGEGLTPDIYVKAMERGEVFFIATGELDGREVVLGFASDYSIDGPRHGTSVYVRGSAARRGVGTALLRLAEAHAREKGAASIMIESSLAGTEFYKANGFVETCPGETQLRSGRPIACVFMHKVLAPSVVPQSHHVVHFNLAFAREPLDHPAMAEFVAQIEPLNQLARASAGFVWTPADDAAGDATSIFGSDRALPNLSVWQSVEDLRRFVYAGPHAAALERRLEWFETPRGPAYVLWWVPAGHRPDLVEARGRLQHLERHGPSPQAFTFTRPFSAPGADRPQAGQTGIEQAER